MKRSMNITSGWTEERKELFRTMWKDVKSSNFDIGVEFFGVDHYNAKLKRTALELGLSPKRADYGHVGQRTKCIRLSSDVPKTCGYRYEPSRDPTIKNMLEVKRAMDEWWEKNKDNY